MKNARILPIALFFLLANALWSCGQEAPSIDFGKAECDQCRMNVVDRQFGAALRTVKGRQYVFDDVACMIAYVDKGTVAEGQVAKWYVCDHAHPGVLIDATAARYAKGPEYRSPMRGDIAAFPTEADRDATMKLKEGVKLDWEQLRKELKP